MARLVDRPGLRPDAAAGRPAQAAAEPPAAAAAVSRIDYRVMPSTAYWPGRRRTRAVPGFGLVSRDRPKSFKRRAADFPVLPGRVIITVPAPIGKLVQYDIVKYE